jgi:hypothetical protein
VISPACACLATCRFRSHPHRRKSVGPVRCRAGPCHVSSGSRPAAANLFHTECPRPPGMTTSHSVRADLSGAERPPPTPCPAVNWSLCAGMLSARAHQPPDDALFSTACEETYGAGDMCSLVEKIPRKLGMSPGWHRAGPVWPAGWRRQGFGVPRRPNAIPAGPVWHLDQLIPGMLAGTPSRSR